MIGLLLITTVLFLSASTTNGCEYTGLAELKLYEKIHPWLNTFFNKQDHERAKTLLKCLLDSTVTAIHKLASSNFQGQVRKEQQIKNSAWEWYYNYKHALKLISQGRDHTEEMLILIYEIKRKHDQLQQAGKFSQKSFRELETILPTNMIAIVFGKSIFIKTQVISYLVSATNTTWINGYLVQTCAVSTCVAETAEWYFEPHEENERLYFIIKNNYKGQRVLALGDPNGEYGGFVEMQKRNTNDNNQKWFVEPVKDGRFVIRNWNGPYIYAYKNRCWATTSECVRNSARSYYKPNMLTDSLQMRYLMMTYPKRCENEKFRELIIDTKLV